MAVEPESPPPLFTIGRVAWWVVLALMLIAIIYSAWHVVANWTFITV